MPNIIYSPAEISLDMARVAELMGTKTFPVFVFGSNLAGNHMGGAARYAMDHFGALSGIYEGLIARSYAIPTLDATLHRLPLREVERYIDRFLTFAQLAPEMSFAVTRIGCGIAGFTDDQIAPLFHLSNLPNVYLPTKWVYEW